MALSPVAKPASPQLNRGHPLAQGLALALPFAGLSTAKTYDASGRDQHGTLTSFAAQPWTGSPFGYAATFDGVDDFVQGGNVSGTFGAAKFTLAVLFRTSGASKQPLFTKEDNITRALNAYVMASGVLELELYDGTNNPTLDTGTAYNDGLWHLAVWTRNAGALKVYVDGRLDNSSSVTVNDCSLSTSLYRLGRRSYTGGGADTAYFVGGMAGVWCWEGVDLPLEQVARLSADPFGMLRRVRVPLKAAAAASGVPKGSLSLIGVGY